MGAAGAAGTASAPRLFAVCEASWDPALKFHEGVCRALILEFCFVPCCIILEIRQEPHNYHCILHDFMDFMSDWASAGARARARGRALPSEMVSAATSDTRLSKRNEQRIT